MSLSRELKLQKIGYWTPIYLPSTRYMWTYEICEQNTWTKSACAEHSGTLCRKVKSDSRCWNIIVRQLNIPILRCKIFVFLKYVYENYKHDPQAHQKSQVHLFDGLFRLNVWRYKRDSSNLFEVLIQTEHILFLNTINIFIDGI